MKRLALMVAALAAGSASASTYASDTLKFGVPQSIAPFVMPNRDGGLLVDISREALATQGTSAEFVYLPSIRTADARPG